MVWHPYAETFDLLQGQELADFEASILASRGNRDPVSYRVLVDGTRQYLDGRNRANACAKLGLALAEVQIYIQDHEVQDFINDKNEARRHTTPEQRRARVARLSAEGHSSRTIAAMVGVSHVTVQRDQEVLGSVGTYVPTEAKPMPTVLPGKVLGQDGKSYDARKDKEHKEPRKPKSGKELFDWKGYGAIWGQLYRQIDLLKRLKGLRMDTPAVEALQVKLVQFDTYFRDLFDELMEPAQAPRPPLRAKA